MLRYRLQELTMLSGNSVGNEEGGMAETADLEVALLYVREQRALAEIADERTASTRRGGFLRLLRERKIYA